jgi:membrane protein DedA with SNARE-associated domain
MLNRFLPGVRAFFFVAAGMAGLRLRAVLFYGALSALAWNVLIIVVGASVGASWDRLRALFEGYTRVLWGLLGLVALVLVARLAWRRLRRPGGA